MSSDLDREINQLIATLKSVNIDDFEAEPKSVLMTLDSTNDRSISRRIENANLQLAQNHCDTRAGQTIPWWGYYKRTVLQEVTKQPENMENTILLLSPNLLTATAKSC